MIFIHSIEELASVKRPLHLALGVFDGVHVGHQAVIDLAVTAASISGGIAGVLTFEPHPIRVLAPERAPRRILASVEHKQRLLESIGVDLFCVQAFTKKFAANEALEFIQALNVNAFDLRSISVGEDWQFGKGRGGNINTLKVWGEKLDFAVTAAPPVRAEGERVSSTRIRQAIRDGNIKGASAMLGRAYSVYGKVEEGRQLARTLGFPTANISVQNEQLPPDGVWQVLVSVGTQWYAGIGNLGLRPTVEEKDAARLLEVHLFDFHKDLYELAVEVRFGGFLRSERKFDSISELQNQIMSDVKAVRSMLPMGNP